MIDSIALAESRSASVSAMIGASYLPQGSPISVPGNCSAFNFRRALARDSGTVDRAKAQVPVVTTVLATGLWSPGPENYDPDTMTGNGGTLVRSKRSSNQAILR